MNFKLIWLILILSVGFLFSKNLLSQERNPEKDIIVITPERYTKIIVRVPSLEGDPKEEAGDLLRRLLNYHLFCLALKDPSPPNLKERSFYLKGSLEKKSNSYLFSGELSALPENKILKRYKAEAASLERLIYLLSDQIIQDISNYKGVSQSRFSFVKREAYSDHLYIMDFSKKNLKKLRSEELILFPKFSEKGDKLAYIVYERGDNFLEIYSLSSGEIKKFKLKGLASAPLWFPDGKNLILTLGKEGEVGIYKFSIEEEEIHPILTGRGIKQAGSLSPDGRYLAYVGDTSGSPQIYLYDLENKKSKRISFEGNYNTSPRFSPKGNLLIYLASTGKKKTLIFYNLKTEEKQKLSLPYDIAEPSFSPTGDFLVFKGKLGKESGIFIIHVDSLLVHPYLNFPHLFYPDWGKMF